MRQSTDTRAQRSPVVDVGPYGVLDLSQDEVAAYVVEGYLRQRAMDLAYVAVGLHVQGLNLRGEPAYVRALGIADAVYADGISVVIAARCAGGRRVEKTTTTDVGWLMLSRLRDRLQRPLKIACVGGPAGLADRAGEVLARRTGSVLVTAADGYTNDWGPVLDRLRNLAPDVVLVGLGTELEAEWCSEHRASLPAALVLPCGGWFAFLTEREKRAPRWAQRAGGEWVWRVAQAPRRLSHRYALGLGSTLWVAFGGLVRRIANGRPAR